MVYTSSRQALIGLILLISPLVSWAQQEVNIHFQQSSDPVKQWLDTRTNAQVRAGDLPARIQQLAPWMQQIEWAKCLSPDPFQLRQAGIDRVYTFRLKENAPISLQNQMRASGRFTYVEEVKSYSLDEISYTPNDDSLSAQWFLSFIEAPQAWDITRGSRQVKIGIIDTGLEFDHPEFEGQIAINALEDANGNGRFDPWPADEQRNGTFGDFDNTDADGNGFVDDVVGYDFTDQPRSPFGGDFLFEDPFPDDDNAHGTLVAGVIGARADNNEGGAGLAPDCKMVILRAFAATGAGEDDDIARSIVYAADNGVDILNLSFGDVYPSTIMHEAIQYAYSQGVIMVSSAGNGTGDALHYPSGYNEVISVSASAADLSSRFEFLWPLSSYGLTVDLCAPGSNIFTTDLMGNDGIPAYTRTQGTSFAAPMVAATAGLLIAHRGPQTPEQIRGAVTTTADDIGEDGWDHLTGAGRLNMRRALQTIGASNVQILSPENDKGSAEEEVAIIGTVLDPEFDHYSVSYREGTTDEGNWITLIDNQPYQRQLDTLTSWDLSGLAEGEYTLRLSLTRTNGFTREDRIRFIRDVTPPQTEIMRAVPVWDNALRSFLLVWRSDDAGRHTVHFRRAGTSFWQTYSYDRITRNGELLLGREYFSVGDYEWYLETENAAGLIGQTPIQTVSFDATYLNEDGFDELTYGFPLGRMLPEPYDLDGDGLLEVIMSEYDNSLGLGRLKSYEFNGSFFRATDSVSRQPILIPKDIVDTDGDGLMELLCSVNDSTYLLEQPNATAFPSEEIYQNEDNGLYSARLGDTDGDGQLELLLKDFEDYFVYERQGNDFREVAKLEDTSPDYTGSVGPRALVEDFDGDGRMETVYGDFDGDLLVFEHGGGNNYSLSFLDTTQLTKSGPYLTAGDFDGDGQQEIFVAVHPSLLRNEDFEYNALYWWLRIFKATGNNEFEVVWEDYLYDIDIESINGATAGNLDNDPADELVFTTYPRTYLLEYQNGSYGFSWFYYGSLASHHVIGDFNGNGVNELGLGRIDSTKFFEKDVANQGPNAVTVLQGFVLGESHIRLEWQQPPGATGYEVWRVRDPLENDQAEVVTIGAVSSFEDTDIDPDVPYLYVLRSLNPGLIPSVSGFGNAVILTPHTRPRLDSVTVENPRQAALWFSQPVIDREADRVRIQLNQRHTPTALVRTGDLNNRLLVSFPRNFSEGENRIDIDTTFLDADRAYLDTRFASWRFRYEPSEDDCLHLTQWETLDDKRAVLYFNLPLEETSALDSTHYLIEPTGAIESVSLYEDQLDAIEVKISEARFGALGYPISITLEDICALNETCLCPEGNTATFSSHKDDLSEVFAYPNPVRRHDEFEGMRFANLTKQATIEVFSLSGRFVRKMEETDGDGGFTWDMLDLTGRRIKPGVYIYYVTTEKEGVEDFVGKFSVVE